MKGEDTTVLHVSAGAEPLPFKLSFLFPLLHPNPSWCADLGLTIFPTPPRFSFLRFLEGIRGPCADLPPSALLWMTQTLLVPTAV